jgi:ADP-ribose pyrophosphatase YjhB (NUDIX family)
MSDRLSPDPWSCYSAWPDISPDHLRAAETEYGAPVEFWVRQELLAWELDLIEKICGRGRFHDVTVFVLRGDKLALIHKPSDPPGAFWAPGGGVHRGEALGEGARRETLEETGLHVTLERYVLRLNTTFVNGERSRPWTSHVFLAGSNGEPLEPLDHDEVEYAAWIRRRVFWESVAPVLCESGWGRFAYRLHLASLVFAELGWEARTLGDAGDGCPGGGERPASLE